MVKLAVVGVGGWGKNLARNYFQIPDCELKYICDTDTSKLEQLQTQLPGIGSCSRFEDMLACSVPIAETGFASRSRLRRTGESLARLLAPLL